MDTRNYCAYNLTRDAFLSLKVAIADPVLQPLRVLEVFVDELGLDSEAALWLTPLATSLQLPRLFPFDIAYLDQNNRIIEALSVVPGVTLPPFRNQFSSALILPEHTLTARPTLPGDEVRICNDEDMAAQLKAIYAAPSPDPIPSTGQFPVPSDAPSFPSSGLQLPLDPIPIEVTRNVESPYELFPSPLAFVPAVNAQASRSAELLLLEPPPIPHPPPAAIPVPTLSIDLAQESSAATVAALAQEAASPTEATVETPVHTTPLSATPVTSQFIAVSEESAQRPVIARRATPIPPSRSVQTTQSLATTWQISTPETAIPVNGRAETSERKKKRPSAPAAQPQANAGRQLPVEEPPAPAVSNSIPPPPPDSHSEWQTSSPADVPSPPNQDSAASVTQIPIAANPEPAPEEPRFFVPSRIRFFDPASDLSDEKNSEALQAGVPPEEDFETRNSNQLPPELRSVIQEITKKERERERQKRIEREKLQEKKPKPRKVAAETATPIPLIPRPKKEAPPANITPDPQPAQRAAEQRPTFAVRILRWLDDAGTHHRRSPRITSPGLVAFYWSGGSPKPHQVLDISDTGFYLLTQELWSPQTMLRVTLQRPDTEEGNPKHSITVLARVVRIGPDGVGHEFVMTESLKRKSLDLLPDKGTDPKALKRFLQPLQ